MSFSISKIHAKNFVLYEELSLNFDSLENNLVFITGENLDVHGSDSNGCGKSLVGDLITDLLFDKTVRKHSQKSFIGKFGKYSFTSMRIKENGGDFFWIRKYRNHATYKDKTFFHLYSLSGLKDLTKKTKADTYKLIWKTLGINWKTFKNRNYYGQGDSERFLRVTDARKAEIIVDIQGLDDLDKSKDRAHQLFKKAKNDKENFELEVINQKFILKSIKKNIVVAEKDHAKTVASRVKILEETNADILSIKESLRVSEKCAGRVKIFSRELDELEEKSEAFITLTQNITVNNHLLSEARKGVKEKTEQRNRLTAKISEAKKEISDLKSKVTTKCGKCGSKLTDQRRSKSIEDVKDHIKTYHKSEIDLTATIETFRNHVRYRKSGIKKLELEAGGLVGVGKAMEKVDLKIKKYAVKASEISVLSGNLSKVKKQRKNLRLELKELHDEKLLKHMKQEFKKREEECSVSSQNLKRAKWRMKKNGIAKAVFDRSIRTMFVTFLNNLNHFSNSFLDTLSDGCITVMFSPVSEKLSKKVVDEISVKVSVAGADSRDFRTYSGGEKGRVEVATQLALFSAADSSFPFLFFDEPFIGIDEDGRARIIDLFKKKADEGNLVIIVSHDNIVSGYGETLNVKRKDGRSWIDA